LTPPVTLTPDQVANVRRLTLEGLTPDQAIAQTLNPPKVRRSDARRVLAESSVASPLRDLAAGCVLALLAYVFVVLWFSF